MKNRTHRLEGPLKHVLRFEDKLELESNKEQCIERQLDVEILSLFLLGAKGFLPGSGRAKLEVRI